MPYVHYVRNHTHVAFNGNFGPFLNKLTYELANWGLITTTQISLKWLNLAGDLDRKQIKNVLFSNKVIYTISPSLFQRPDHWHENRKILGFPKRNASIDWNPDKELSNFLEKHRNNKILFITFGSMTNPEPEKKTNILLEILGRHEIPAIINTASGGLIKPDEVDSDLFHFVSHIPYECIFPKMYAVIHHGGSGTTHLSLRHGCATMVIPHIIDQFVWNEIVSNIGAGPKGIKMSRLTAKKLEPKILELLSITSFKAKAEQVARKMEQENFRQEIYSLILREKA